MKDDGEEESETYTFIISNDQLRMIFDMKEFLGEEELGYMGVNNPGTLVVEKAEVIVSYNKLIKE